MRQRQTGSIDGGIIILADNTPLAAVDQDNQPSDDDSTMDVWHNRVIPMDNLVGKTFQSVRLGGSNGRRGSTGAFTIEFASIAVVSADGTVRTVYNGGSGSASYVSGLNMGMSTQSVDTTVLSAKFFTADHLGSTAMEFTSGGWPVTSQDYTPYGKLVSTMASADHYKLTGKERDEESTDASGNGVDYFGARHYSAGIGRFMTADPNSGRRVEPQSLNKYAYVLNNPLTRFDPNGLYDVPCEYSQEDIESDEDGNGTPCSDAFGDEFASDLAAARRQAESLVMQDRDLALRAIDAYGSRGDHNGVQVSRDDELGHAQTSFEYAFDGHGNVTSQHTSVTFTLAGLQSEGGSALVGHEGSHIADFKEFMKSGDNPLKLEGEEKAYQTQFLLQGANWGFMFRPGLDMLGVPVYFPGPWSSYAPQISNAIKSNPLYSDHWMERTFSPIPR